LRLHGVLRCAEKASDARVLLDPLEKELDLPAAFVESANNDGRKLEIVG